MARAKIKTKTTTDLTKGNPWKQILLFTWPVLLGGIFQQVYSLADTLIVGRVVSLDALAAVGATGPISFLMQSIAMGITSGFAVYTSQRYGAGDEEGVRRSIAANIVVSVILTLVLTLVCSLTTAPVLRLMQVPADIFQNAYDYLLVVYLGFVGIIFYNMFAQLLRAMGDSFTPLLFLILTCGLNVGMDFWFIPSMGVKGAALATVLSQLISVVFCMIYAFWRYPSFRLSKRHWRVEGKFYWSHFRIGIPMAFQFSITSIGVIINQSVLNTLGSTAIATYTAAQKVEQFLSQTFVAIGLASATFIAQNYGAKNIKRIRQGMWISILFAVILSIIACITVLVGGQSILKIFLSDDVPGAELAEVMEYGRIYFLTNGPAYIFLALLFVFRNALQGVGKSIGTVYGGVAELVMRVGAALGLAQILGFQGVCIANPAAWVGSMLIQLILFIFYFGRVKRSMAAADTAETTDPSVLSEPNGAAVAAASEISAGAVPVTLTTGGYPGAQRDTLIAGAAVSDQLDAFLASPDAGDRVSVDAASDSVRKSKSDAPLKTDTEPDTIKTSSVPERTDLPLPSEETDEGQAERSKKR